MPCSSTRSGPDPARSTRVRTPLHVDVAQLVVGVGQLAPDADVLGQVGHDWSSGNRARASATVHRPALCRRATPSACSRREFSMVRNSTGSSAESL